MSELTHLSLFSGIGGFDLAAEAAGFVTVGQCEWADYPTKVLEKHWPDVPRWRDIRTLTKESFYERTGLRTVDVISGGFPCQPFSVAGQRRGEEDDRYLWPEMLRVIQEIRPTWVVGENVAGIVSMALDTVLSDLEALGYAFQTFIIPACGVDAPHRRDRCAILAYAHGSGLQGKQFNDAPHASWREESQGPTCKRSTVICNSTKQGLQNRKPATILKPRKNEKLERSSGGATKPGLGGVADGLSHWLDEPHGVPRTATGIKDRVNRLKCLGNAVVPQQFYPFFKAIADIERLGVNGKNL